MPIEEIVLPITTPETEWVLGRALRKMSPTRDHSRMQTEFASALNAWSRGRGEVGTEWRFRLQPPGRQRRPLVPDLAFVSGDRLRGHSDDAIQAPAFAPNVAIEILSPRDRAADVASKIDVYLASGTSLVIVVDPVARTMTLHDDGATEFILRAGDTLRHAALPGFSLDVGATFTTALERRF